jgi:hypothetical protein
VASAVAVAVAAPPGANVLRPVPESLVFPPEPPVALAEAFATPPRSRSVVLALAAALPPSPEPERMEVVTNPPLPPLERAIDVRMPAGPGPPVESAVALAVALPAFAPEVAELDRDDPPMAEAETTP